MSRCSASSPRRVSAPTCRRSVSSRSRKSAGIPAERILFHGNNKSDEELRAAAAAAHSAVVLDAEDEPARAASAGVQRALVRLTPGVEAVTHRSIQTAHDESKFGLPAESALRVVDEARTLGIDVVGRALPRRLAARAHRREPARRRAARRILRTRACGARLDTAGARHRRRPRHPVHPRLGGARRSQTSSARSSRGCASAGPTRCRSCSSPDGRSSAAQA